MIPDPLAPKASELAPKASEAGNLSPGPYICSAEKLNFVMRLMIYLPCCDSVQWASKREVWEIVFCFI